MGDLKLIGGTDAFCERFTTHIPDFWVVVKVYCWFIGIYWIFSGSFLTWGGFVQKNNSAWVRYKVKLIHPRSKIRTNHMELP